MSELVEFIRGCLDADEQTARATLGDYAAHKASWEIAGSGVVFLGDEDDLADFLTIGDGPVAQHIARHDPERVLAEVNAKRAILQNALNVIASFGDWDADAAIKAGGFALWPDVTRRERQQAHDTIDELAQCFRGEPGWRDEWGTQ